jgi:hypothetical protein
MIGFTGSPAISADNNTESFIASGELSDVKAAESVFRRVSGLKKFAPVSIIPQKQKSKRNPGYLIIIMREKL